MTRDLASSWGVKQPGDSPVVRVVMCQSGGGTGMPQEDGAALLSLHGTFFGGEGTKKPHFHGLSAPCVGGFGDFRVWGMKNSGHPHGIKAPLFVADAHVSWSSPLLSLYGTSWWSAKAKHLAWTQYQGPRGEEA